MDALIALASRYPARTRRITTPHALLSTREPSRAMAARPNELRRVHAHPGVNVTAEGWFGHPFPAEMLNGAPLMPDTPTQTDLHLRGLRGFGPRYAVDDFPALVPGQFDSGSTPGIDSCMAAQVANARLEIV